MIDYEAAYERYAHDSDFHKAVDIMMLFIRQLRLTPGDLKAAAVFAECRHAMMYPSPELIRICAEHERKGVTEPGEFAL